MFSYSAARSLKPALFMVFVCGVLLFTGCAKTDSTNAQNGSTPTVDEATQGLEKVAASQFVNKTALAEVTITVKDNEFSPQYITVSPGTKVIFNNQGRNPHNVYPVASGEFQAIATDDLGPEEQAPLVIADPGMYPYYCTLHGTPKKGMNGRIQVVAE
ncbi:MAG: cupredoxin domain-containing protein [Actinomycetes bacterium]